MMSTKGMEILSEMYRLFRDVYIQDNPGCNENDVERYFLTKVYFGTEIWISTNLVQEIDSIR